MTSIDALASKQLNCPHCGVASNIGVDELLDAYELGAKVALDERQTLRSMLHYTLKRVRLSDLRDDERDQFHRAYKLSRNDA